VNPAEVISPNGLDRRVLTNKNTTTLVNNETVCPVKGLPGFRVVIDNEAGTFSLYFSDAKVIYV
jgi:hypothetical protein